MRNWMVALVPALGALLLLVGSSVTATPQETATSYRFEEVPWVWLKTDVDADGRLTREEVWSEDAALAARFDEADLDSNGTLSAREFEVLLMTA